MNIEYRPRIELNDLIDFIATEKGIAYNEAEKLLPDVYFEGATICDDYNGDWCKEVVEYLKEKKIVSVEVYQDY